MIWRRVVFVLLIWVSLSSLSGCAAFRSGETKPAVPWPMSNGPGKQSISLLVTGESILNGKKISIFKSLQKQYWQDHATKAYKNSGLFSDVKTGAAETDLRAEIHMRKRSETNFGLGVLSSLSLTLIPSFVESELVAQTTLKNKEGRDLGTFEKKEDISYWSQLFLIFIMPFNWPDTVDSDLLHDLHRATISQAHDAGLLQAW